MTAKYQSSSKTAPPAKDRKDVEVEADAEAKKPRTITLQTKDGEVEWIPISERRKLYLQQYPSPEYREEIDVMHLENPVGFVQITARCQCYPSDGEPYTVIERHAFGYVLDAYKSFERIETAAVGRLYTALGIEGQVFDEEEKLDAMNVGEPMPWDSQEYRQRHGQGAASTAQDRPSAAKPSQASQKNNQGGKPRTGGQKTVNRINRGFPKLSDSPEQIGDAMAEEIEGSRTH